MKKFRFEFRNYESPICQIDDPGAGAPVGTPDAGAPAPSGDVTDPVTDPAAPPVDPNAPPVDPTQADPADPLTAELDKLGKELGDGEQPPADPNAAAIPQGFQQALQISPFVTNAQQMTQAVQAAHEVWQVATGQVPARTMLEGFKAVNPQAYDAAVSDLTQYIEQVTGKKFGGEGAPADPVQQLRDEIAQKEQQQQEAVQQQQVQRAQIQASNVTFDFVKNALKDSYFAGQEDYFARQVVAAMPNRDAVMREILNGNTKPLEAAMKQVQRAEIARWKSYNENFAKSRKTLANSVPATKNTPRTASPAGAAPTFRSAGHENETAAQFSARHWQWSGSQN